MIFSLLTQNRSSLLYIDMLFLNFQGVDILMALLRVQKPSIAQDTDNMVRKIVALVQPVRTPLICIFREAYHSVLNYLLVAPWPRQHTRTPNQYSHISAPQ